MDPMYFRLYLRSILITDGIGIAILLVLHYASHAKILRRRTEDRLYSMLVTGVLLGCVMDAFSYAIDGIVFPCARVLNYVANTYIFTANVLLPFFLLVYIDLCLYNDKSRIRKHYKPQIILLGILFAANVVNFFTPVSFYITEGNSYERGPLFPVYYAAIVFYCVTSIVLLKRYEKENGARTFFNFNMYVIPVVVGAGLQFLFYRLSLAWLASAIGMVGVYMMQQNEMAYIDPLVDTYNRQYMDHLLSAWISRNNSFSGVMLDIDNFKQVNDRIGHSEGDKALKKVTEILKRAGHDREWVFRFAGDEFIVLKKSGTPEELEAYMDEVNRRLKDCCSEGDSYRLTLSYGISSFDGGTIDDFLGKMDEKMYRMKERHHKEFASEVQI